MASLEAVDHDPFAGAAAITVRPGGSEPSKTQLTPVDHDPFATDYSGTAKDVAKSAGIGVVRGAIGLGGLLGDVTDAAAKGIKKASDFVSDQTGVPRYEPTGSSVLNNIPTIESLTKNIENVTGDFYQPQTTAGHYAQTIGEFAPAALMGPGGIARKLALGAAIPGAASEAAGQATAGSPVEPYARAAGGLVGGLGGALLSRPSSAEGALQRQLQNVPQTAVDDARSLMQSAKAKGVDLTWPEALAQVGHPVLSDTQRILESAPSSRGQMQQFYAQRPQQFDQAALNEFAQIAPGSRNPSQIGPQVGQAAQGHIGDIRGAINRASEPYYKQAEAVRLTPAEMSHVRAIPGWTEARDAVRNNPQINWRVSHLPDNSVGFLNQVKKQFDQAAQNAGSKFNPAKNHEVQASNEMAASAVKQIGEAKSADYQIALAIQQQAREQFLDPLLQGPLGRLAKKDVTTRKAIDALFPSNPIPNSHNEIHEAVSDLAAKNPGAATQLVRAHVESVFNQASKKLQTGENQFGAAKFANRLIGNIQQRENLKAAVEALPNGRQLWNGFDDFLAAAEATGTRQAKGSLTSFNTQDLKAMSGGGLVGEAVKTGLSPGKWWTVVSEKYGQWKLGSNLDELARIFTDPNSAALLKRISTMPSGGREAQFLASRLILQAQNALSQPRESRRQ